MSLIWLYFCVSCFVLGYHVNSMRSWASYWWRIADAVFWPIAGLLILIEKVKQ